MKEEELAWGDAGIAVSIGATGLAGAAIVAMGTEEQKQKYIGMLTDPKELRLAAMGLTEPNSGSDSLALETTATRVDGGYVLNGTKQFCTNGGIADIQVAFATTDKSMGPAGIAGLRDREGHAGDAPGPEGAQARRPRVAHRAGDLRGLLHPRRSAPRPRQERQGDRSGRDRRHDHARGDAADGRGRCASASPVRRSSSARDYSLQRVAFGKPIARHEAIAFKLADMATEIDAARLLTWRAGWMAMNGIPFARGEGSMAKLYAGDMAMRVTVDAVQILGGYGYIKDYPVERFMRDAKIYQIWEGTAEIQRLVISRYVLGERTATARPKLVENPPPVHVAAAS